MSTLHLYCIFHGNLNYSSIPPEMYEQIIDHCYWPILDLINEYNFVTGIEFPFNTITKINEIDPLFLSELKKITKQNKCELICSGKEQTVFPLIPYDVNKTNLTMGKKLTEEFFSTKIKTAYINEQLFSSGLVDLYINSGIKNIITIWEWVNKVSNLQNKIKYHPTKISTNTTGQLNIIWNSYISYQKFQRYLNGELELNDYWDYLLKQKNQKQDACFPLYGSDMEIFGYKNPVLGLAGDGKEIERFRKILDKIEKDVEMKFGLPSSITQRFKPVEEIDLNSAKFAILGKKQEKFTITRWAVCGRDSGKSNTQCYNILKKIKTIDALCNKKQKNNNEMSELIDCWASDYRTHTTESKHVNFSHISHILDSKLNQQLIFQKKNLIDKKNYDLLLYNPNNNDWNTIPFELQLHFKPKKFQNDFIVLAGGKEIRFQLENKKYYKDGSLRSVALILEPLINKKSHVLITLQKTETKTTPERSPVNEISTPNAKLSLLSRKGAAISFLTFPQIFKNPLIGFLEHGTFDDTKLSSDFYSGHTVAFDRTGNKFTDLVETQIFYENNTDPIRKKIFCDLELPFGHLTKIFYVYQNHPRVDLRYIFNFNSFRPSSFRTGIITLIPSSFDRSKISYSTHNGGKLESFNLTGETVNQDESTDPRNSSIGCLGSTENMIDFGDDKKGITLFSDKSLWYSVPMINYHEVGKSFFYRVSNSVSELDDTTMTWWKGRKEISFSLFGRSKNNLTDNEKISKLMFVNLICVSKNSDIVVI